MRLKTEIDFIELLHAVFELWWYWFPIWSVLKDYKIWDNLRPDIVIALDEPLAIIDVKKWNFDLISATKQLKKYYKEINNKNVELYLACFWPIDEPKKTKFYQYNNKIKQLEEIKYLPDYEYFLNKRKRELRKNLFISINWLKVIWLFLWILFILFWWICIIFEISVSSSQFLILLLWVWLIILPFLAKIKFSWIELEMNSKK